jgi:hypothetical protein
LLLDEGACAAQPSLEPSRSDLRIANAAHSLLFDELRQVPWTPSLGVLSESEVRHGKATAAVQSRV